MRPQGPAAPAPPRAAPPVPGGPGAARVGSPRPPAVSPVVAPAAPRPPSVAPPAGAARGPGPATRDKTKPKYGRWEEEPESDGWDNADTMTSFPEPSELPEPTPRMLPPVEATPPPLPAAVVSSQTQASPETATPATPASPGTMRGPYPTAPGVAPPPVPLPAGGAKAGAGAPSMAQPGLGAAREEVWTIVRAAVEEAIGPLLARQRELEARLERAENQAARPAAQAGGASAVSKLASIPPSPLGPALMPAVFRPVDSSATSIDLSPPVVSRSGGSAHPVGPRPSGAPQGYGVSVIPGPRPTLDLDAVGPVDIGGFDGGARRRTVARVVVVLMLLLIGGAILMMVLSYN